MVSGTQTATEQASLLFVVAGTLGALTLAFTGVSARPVALAVNLGSIALGLCIHWLDWSRWGPHASLTLVPLALALIVTGQFSNPESALAVYGVWYVVLFAWIGSWHPPRTSLAFAPMAALAYVIPFLPGLGPSEALVSVIVGIPAGVVLGEVIAAKHAAMARVEERLRDTTTLLERANLTDDLTGVGNRRHSNAMLEDLRVGDGLVLLDLDHFKRVNDTWGHAEGDRILVQLGSYLSSAVREADTVARFGGEEFVVVVRRLQGSLPPTVERLLAGWRETCGGVTLSAGAAIHRDGRAPSDTFQAADACLYQAKATGRDRCVVEAHEACADQGSLTLPRRA